MTLVCSIILVITAICIMLYDWKYQRIPMILLLINYSSICLLVNNILLIGLAVIILARLLDFPIDYLYLVMIGYLIIINGNYLSCISIIILLLFTVFSKRDKLSFMIPLELAVIIEIIIKETML